MAPRMNHLSIFLHCIWPLFSLDLPLNVQQIHMKVVFRLREKLRLNYQFRPILANFGKIAGNLKTVKDTQNSSKFWPRAAALRFYVDMVSLIQNVYIIEKFEFLKSLIT